MSTDDWAVELRSALIASTTGSLLDPRFAKILTPSLLRRSFGRHSNSWSRRTGEIAEWIGEANDASEFIDRCDTADHPIANAAAPFTPDRAAQVLHTYQALMNEDEALSKLNSYSAARIVTLSLHALAGSSEWETTALSIAEGTNPDALSRFLIMSRETDQSEFRPLRGKIEHAIYTQATSGTWSSASSRHALIALGNHGINSDVLSGLTETQDGDVLFALSRNPGSTDEHLAQACMTVRTMADAQPSSAPINLLSTFAIHPNAGDATHEAALDFLNALPAGDNTQISTDWFRAAHRVLSGTHAVSAWTRLVPHLPHIHANTANSLRFTAAMSAALPSPMRTQLLAECNLAQVEGRNMSRDAVWAVVDDTPAGLLAMLLSKAATWNMENLHRNGNLEKLLCDAIRHPDAPLESIAALSKGAGVVNRVARATLKDRKNQTGPKATPTRKHQVVSNCRATVGQLAYGEPRTSDEAFESVIDFILSPGNSETRRIMADIWVDMVNADPTVIHNTPPEALKALQRFRHPFKFTTETLLALGQIPAGSELASKQIAKALSL